jgi:hypothetical protein
MLLHLMIRIICNSPSKQVYQTHFLLKTCAGSDFAIFCYFLDLIMSGLFSIKKFLHVPMALFFWLALLASDISIRILLFGWMGLDLVSHILPVNTPAQVHSIPTHKNTFGIIKKFRQRRSYTNLF